MSKSLNAALLAICLVFMAYVLKPILIPIIFSVILAVSIYPLVYFLETKLKLNKQISALLGVLFITTLAILSMMFLAYQLTDVWSKSDIYVNRLTAYFNEVQHHIHKRLGLTLVPHHEMPETQIRQLLSDYSGSIAYFMGSASSFIGDLLLVPLYVFFLLSYNMFFLEFFYKVCAKLQKNMLDNILKNIYELIHNYLKGMVIVMLIVGTLNSIGLLLLGIDNAVFFGFLAAVLLLIPYIGIFIGSILPMLVALATKDSPWYAVGVLGIFGFIQVLEGNFITPKVTGSKVQINALIAIISFMLFGMLWGMAGLILALPITAALKVIFDSNEALKPYGFLIGEPEAYHFSKSSSRYIRFKYYILLKKKSES